MLCIFFVRCIRLFVHDKRKYTLASPCWRKSLVKRTRRGKSEPQNWSVCSRTGRLYPDSVWGWGLPDAAHQILCSLSWIQTSSILPEGEFAAAGRDRR